MMKSVIIIVLLLFLNSCASLKDLHRELLESDTFTAPETGMIYGSDGPHHYIVYPDGDIYIN